MKHHKPYEDIRVATPKGYEDVFSHFYFASNQTGRAIHKTLMPSFQTIMVFSFGGGVQLHGRSGTTTKLGKCAILGPLTHAIDYTLWPEGVMLVASFKDDAFYRFFNIGQAPLWAITDPSLLAGEGCFTSLWDSLSTFNEPVESVKQILAFSIPYLRGSNPVATQLASLGHAGVDVIKAVASSQQQSTRAIQMRHKKYFGYTAKAASRHRRFAKAVGLLQGINTTPIAVDWFQIIEACGYYDQSQLIHDFKYYTHLSPTQYLKCRNQICSATY